MNKKQEKEKIISLKNVYDQAMRRKEAAEKEVLEIQQRFKDFLGFTPQSASELDDAILKKLGQIHLEEIRTETLY